MSQRMLDAFIEYERSRVPVALGARHNKLHFPPGTRLMRMDRRVGCWWVWIATRDYINGTYMCVWDDGHVERVTIREEEGDEFFTVRPSDDEINRSIVR